MSQPTLPTPSSDQSSRDEQQALKRTRVQNDASVRSDIAVPPNSNIVREGFTYERYRVGGPPLQLLPLNDTSLAQTDPATPVLRQLRPQINAILRKFGVERDQIEDAYGSNIDIEFVHRTVDDQPPSLDNLTILIPAIWDNSAPFQWLHVVNELRGILMQDFRTRPVKVEVIGRQFLLAQTLAMIEDSHPIVAAWPTIRPQLHAIIAQSERLRDRWWSIGTIRMGHTDWSDEGSGLPVVLSIMVNWDVNPVDWHDAESLMKDLLASNNLSEVGIVFSRGEISPNTFPIRESTGQSSLQDVIDGDYSGPMGIGSNIGPARCSRAAEQPIGGPCGTLGGYFEATDIKTGAIKRLGVTSYHVVRPTIDGHSSKLTSANKVVENNAPQGSDLDSIDRSGMKPDFRKRNQMIFESPSRRSHNCTLRQLEEDLVISRQEHGPSGEPTLLIQHEADQKRKFFDEGKNILGNVWATSGLCQRTSENGRLDWALIEFSDSSRLGSNIAPPANEWPRPSRAPKDLAGHILRGIGSCKDGPYRRSVFQKGARTGLTHGQFNSVKDDVNCHLIDGLAMPYSSEYAYISLSKVGNSFAIHEDPGAFVFTSKGEVIGLVWGASKNDTATTNRLVYVTDAVSLLEHMNAQYEGSYTFQLAED